MKGIDGGFENIRLTNGLDLSVCACERIMD